MEKRILLIFLLNFNLYLSKFVEAETSTTLTTPTTTTRTTTPPAECFNPYCICYNGAFSDQLLCEEFDSFDQLDFKNEPETSIFKNFFFSKLTLKPNKPLVFDDRLDLTGVNLKTSGVTIDKYKQPNRIPPNKRR